VFDQRRAGNFEELRGGGEEIEWRSVCAQLNCRGMCYRGGRGKCMGRKVTEERLDRVVISVWETERSVCTFHSSRFFVNVASCTSRSRASRARLG